TNGANAYAGGTLVNSGVLVGAAPGGNTTTTGPFGSNAGAVSIIGGTLELNPAGVASNTGMGALTANSGSGTLMVNAASTSPITTWSFGAITQQAPGTLIINSGALNASPGVLNTNVIITGTGAGVAVTNGIVPTWIVGNVQGQSTNGDFLNYSAG